MLSYVFRLFSFGFFLFTKSYKMRFVLFAVVLSAFSAVRSDTPANCHFDEVVGSWTFMIGASHAPGAVECNESTPLVNKYKVELVYPNVAVDEFNNVGFWTLIYNQGFELRIAGRTSFSFFKYIDVGPYVSSFCGELSLGWIHDVVGKNWACFRAKKPSAVEPRTDFHPLLLDEKRLNQFRVTDEDKLIRQINSAQSSWQAGPSVLNDDGLFSSHLQRAGGRFSSLLWRPKPGPISPEIAKAAKALPSKWDWRNMNGKNFISPIRNQGHCGSCYAFASMAMLEARVRVLTNTTSTPVFSPQDIVECSTYSQGCRGGFPYLVAGRYGQDFGVVAESCNPYLGRDGACSTPSDCRRFYTSSYRYVGGYYGACNEAEMRIALVERGPFAVSIMVYPDLRLYHAGIYHHVETSHDALAAAAGFDPFQVTNHVVLIVGYGTEPQTGQDFWIVKNSWGEEWGEKGFFRIRRGSDECSLESMAVEADPVLF